jgi:hypothetical protein
MFEESLHLAKRGWGRGVKNEEGRKEGRKEKRGREIASLAQSPDTNQG